MFLPFPFLFPLASLFCPFPMTAKNKEVLLASVLLAQQKGQHNCGYTLSLEVDYRFNEQVDLGRFKFCTV